MGSLPSSGQIWKNPQNFIIFLRIILWLNQQNNYFFCLDILLQMAASHHMQMSADVKVNAGMSNMQMRQQQHMVQQQQQSMFYQNQTAAATGQQQPTGTQQQQQSQTQVVQQQAQQQQQQQPGMDNTYTYSASQTQTINFTQQHLRANTRMPASLSVQQQAAQQQQQALQHQQAAQQQQVQQNKLWNLIRIVTRY